MRGDNWLWFNTVANFVKLATLSDTHSTRY